MDDVEKHLVEMDSANTNLKNVKKASRNAFVSYLRNKEPRTGSENFTKVELNNILKLVYANARNKNIKALLLGRRQANLYFHFAGSGENLPDIAKSRDATMRNKLFGCQLKNLMK